MAEQQLTNEEIIERLQESITLIDKLSEREILEKKLREVRDLGERLQEVDEIAERLQEVIEEELGKEEVDQLRREEEEDLEKEVQKGVDSKEEEVDELEEEIKRVFLKGLLPEDEELEVKEVSEKVVKDGTLLDDSLREDLHQTASEEQNEMEVKFGTSGVVSTTSVVTYQEVEGKIKKKVTIVEERGWRREEMEDVLLQTEIVENITVTEVTERLQPEDPSQVAEKDVWFILFDRPPYKAVFKPPGKVFPLETSLILYYHYNVPPLILFICALLTYSPIQLSCSNLHVELRP